MKKYIGFAVLASLVFSFSSAVLAEENSGTSNTDDSAVNTTFKAAREALKSELKAKKEALKAKAKEQREAFRAALKAKKEAFDAEVKAEKEEFKKANTEKKDKFRKKAGEIIDERFESAFKNLEKSQNRVAELISKVNANNKDTTIATEFLNSSTQKLADAKAKVAELRALVPTTGEAVTAEVFEKIKLGAREAKDLLKEAHNDLKQAVKELKNLKDKEEENEDESENENEN